MAQRSVATISPNYWIVGAARSGTDDHYDDFISKGYWKLFWAKGVDPVQESRGKQIQQGDLIAIKKMVGGRNGKGKIRIRALGTVEGVSLAESKVRVKWLRTGLDQVIDGHGLYGSIHGPFKRDDKVVRDVFLQFDEIAESQSHNSALGGDLRTILAAKEIDETTKQALIDARVGQGKFRSDVLKFWSNRCATTGSYILEAIRASHIKPWCDSTNIERLDPSNGLPLVASLDALFDAGFISFDNSGCVIISSKLLDSERAIYGLSQKRLRRKPSEKTAAYLHYHRTTVFRE